MKNQNASDGNPKLYSFLFGITIAFYLLIILFDILLLVLERNYFDALAIAFVGMLYILLYGFRKSWKQQIMYPAIVFFLTAIILSLMDIRNGYSEGSFFYLLPAAAGYLNFTAGTRNKVRFRQFYFIVFSFAAVVIIQYFLFRSPSTRAAANLLFSYRLIASYIFTALLITHASLLRTSQIKSPEKVPYLDAVFHAYPEAYIIYDKETLEVYDYNKSLVQMIELPETTELNGLYITQVMMRYLDADSPNLELLMNHIPDEWSGEATFITYAKNRFDAHVKSFVLENDEIHYQILSIRNINEMNKAKEELRIYKEKMEKAAKAKARFLSNMSHELRTPLNGIIGTSNLVLGEKNLPEGIKNNINILKYSSEHMLGIINDILDYSKIDAGKLELKRYPFNIKESLDKLVKTFANEFDNKKIELLFTHDPRIAGINIISDQVKINQILANLLSNALKFTISGRVTLLVAVNELTDKNVTISFEVKDTGIGISKERHEEIFHDFVQVIDNDNELRRFDGTGLGLTISEKLVSTFGGKLQVESELEKGARFFFTLNFDLAQEKSIPKPEIANNGIKPDIRGVRILIVEDNEINAGILKSFLLKWEIRILEARNGIHALELLKFHKFDLILMDLEMPEMNGYMAVKKIRETDKEIPVIAFTAALLEDMDSLITESGFNDYVLKPFRPSELKKKIEFFVPHRKIEYI